jgi:hypothetical protein
MSTSRMSTSQNANFQNANTQNVDFQNVEITKTENVPFFDTLLTSGARCPLQVLGDTQVG